MKKYLLIFCGTCLIIGSIYFIIRLQAVKQQLVSTQNPSSASKHSSHLFDPAFFTQAYDKDSKYKNITDNKVIGGIIPHHLVAAPLIAGFFDGISHQKVSAVILLSPNHYGLGPYDVTTSEGIWTTIFGDLDTDVTKVGQLEEDKTAFVNEDLFDTEHGIYGITPFIKKTFPDAKLIPIVIKGGASKEECDRLAQSLNKITDEHTIIIVSSDFSHYLPSDQADLHDQVTIPAIESFNTDKVFSLDHVKDTDSPESIYTLLKVMQLKNATKPIFLANSNSAKLTGQLDVQSTTSYLTMYFTNQKDKLSKDSIFNYIDPALASAKDNKPDEYTIIATGDVIPARTVNTKLLQLNDFNYPFENTVDFLRSANAVFINLETPLIPNCKSTTEGMIFCGDQRAVQGLKYAGVTVTSIANNHAGNYGVEGVNSTVKLLRDNNIQVTGNGETAILTIKDKKFGFLGYNDIGSKEVGIAWANDAQIQQDIQSLKNKVDFIIVTFHWGVEYTSTPNARQVELAHTAIDAGADLIIGNHPHWVQGTENYKGKFITYAHGNFVFDQMWSQETREGVLGKYTFNNQGLINVEFVPVIIDNYSQPRFATKKEALNILDRMKTSTNIISQTIVNN